ncbi:hypothetical protein C8Q75DRAFT_714655 [Abortiporus biennis]|nr:hypothetical protein C8Q75DRAFT_714655 [Abortiporus biennis]
MSEPATVAFVKGGKRKRLSKACDACHKSKRRCDGTAPCSNCYFASKECTYTDSAGRPVPAPRNIHPQLALEQITHEAAAQQAGASAGIYQDTGANSRGNRRVADVNVDANTKRHRLEGLAVDMSITGAVGSSSTALQSTSSPPSALLDPATTHELVNLFFTHCNPNRVMIHKPSFSAALAHDQVPSYLLLALCSNAAPLSKDLGAKASLPRLAGVPFFQEAVSIMFDASGRLLAEPTLATAQALCLLEMHEVAASHSWTKHYRYFDLALQILEETLDITKPDYVLPSSGPLSPGARTSVTERECIRRCFWLIEAMQWINGIYTYKPLRPRTAELIKLVRLPCDETSFELVVPVQTAEYLHTPAPRTKYASQFGHMCRVLYMYHTLEAVIVDKEGADRARAVSQLRSAVETWVASLADHLRFSEETLEKQVSMFETSANTGAWCFCLMHVMHPCLVLSLLDAEGKQGDPIGWVRNQLNLIFTGIGTRAKNTMLSACALWSYSKYQPNDPQLHKWDDDFEKVWGFRVAVVADQWRKCQAEQRSHIGRSYPVESISKSDSPPEFQAMDPSPSPPSNFNNHSTSPLERTNSLASASSSSASSSSRHFQHSQQTQMHISPTHQHIGMGGGAVVGYEVDPNMGRRDSQSLPSLKASGLLEAAWKPPTEAFSHSLSISPRNTRHQVQDDLRASNMQQIPNGSISGLGGGMSMGMGMPSSVRGGGTSSMPVGLNWLNNES